MDIDVVGDAKADGDGAGKVGADQAKTLMMSLDVGSIYVPDPELVYREMNIVRTIDNMVVVGDGVEGHPESIFPISDCLNVPSYPEFGYHDMIEMESLHTASILYNLRLRFEQDIIYTYMGGILVSVNPFKPIDLYTPEAVNLYRESNMHDHAPHIYATADAVYRALLRGDGDQSIVISGESGAGKTEAAKIVLQYIAEVASKTGAQKPGMVQASFPVHERILATNPILEAFGNAKTIRNNNSSRFGKLLEIQLQGDGFVSGALFETYLLEKLRVTKQNPDERNFHSFYYLLATVDPSERQMWQLGGPADYRYLKNTVGVEISGEDAAVELAKLKASMTVAGFNAADQANVFNILAAILWLGNLSFSKAESSAVENTDVLNWAAYLLGCDPAGLATTLTSRTNVIKGETFFVPLDQFQSVDTCDTLAQHLYAKVFHWIVDKLNVSMTTPTNSDGGRVLLLDVFGFEIFTRNSFEQLCINYANERLQLQFNEYVFRLEQREYAAEGIQVEHVAFTDNQGCIDLVDLPPVGILFLINEEAHFPKGTDQTLLQKIVTTHANSTYLEPDRFKGSAFHIKHYAGKVKYEVSGFLSKNRERFSKDLLRLIANSYNDFLKTIFASAIEADAVVEDGKRLKTATKSTVALEFRTSLVNLCDKLATTQSNFIRCIKSNDACRPDVFDAPLVNRQLRYIGALETIRIRREGYAQRRTADTFLERYWCVMPLHLRGKKPNLEILLEQLKPEESSGIALGASKIFIKADAFESLERRRFETKAHAATHIQAHVRGRNTRRFVKTLREAIVVLHAACAAYIAKTDYRMQIRYALQKIELPHSAEKLQFFIKASTRNVQAIFECGGADIIIDAILSGKSSPTQKSALIRVLVGMIANEHFAGIITRRPDYDLLRQAIQGTNESVAFLDRIVEFAPDAGVVFRNDGLAAINSAIPVQSDAAAVLSKLMGRGKPCTAAVGRDSSTILQLVSELNRTNKFSAQIQYLLRCLVQLSKNKHHVESLVACGAVEACLSAWARLPNEVSVGREAADLITALLPVPGVIDRLNVREGLLPFLLQTLSTNPASASFVHPLLVEIVRWDPTLADKLEEVLAQQGTLANAESLASWAAALKYQLDLNANTNGTQQYNAVVSCIRGLRQFPESLTAVSATISSLRALIRADMKTALEAIDNENGLAAIAFCAIQHYGAPEIQDDVIAIGELMITPERIRGILNEVQRAIMDATSSSPDSLSLIFNTSVLALASNSESHCKTILDDNGIAKLLSVLQQKATDVSSGSAVPVNALRCLAHVLARSPDVLPQMAKLNGMAIAKLAVHQNANLFEAYLDFVRFDPDSIAGIASMATFRDAIRRDGRVANAAVRCITRAPPSAVNTAWVSAITEALPVLDTAHLLEALPFLTVHVALVDGDAALAVLPPLINQAVANSPEQAALIAFARLLVDSKPRIGEARQQALADSVQGAFSAFDEKSEASANAVTILSMLFSQSEAFLLSTAAKSVPISTAKFDVDKNLPVLVKAALEQVSNNANALRQLLQQPPPLPAAASMVPVGAAVRSRAVLVKEEALLSEIRASSQLLTGLQQQNPRARQIMKEGGVTKVLKDALEAAAVADESAAHQSALVAMAPLFAGNSASLSSIQIQLLHRFSYYEGFSVKVIPVLNTMINEDSSGAAAAALDEQGLISAIHAVLHERVACDEIILQALKTCHSFAKQGAVRSDLIPRGVEHGVVQCLTTAPVLLDYEKEAVEIALSALQLILSSPSKSILPALTPDVVQFVVRCMVMHANEIDVMRAAFGTLLAMAQHVSLLQGFCTNADLQRAIMSAVIQHATDADLCADGMKLMSMLVKAEAAIPMATLSQKDGSGESVFLLANLRNATRRQVCGQVLPMACGQEVDVILSALRAHPNDKRIAVACLKLLSEADAAVVSHLDEDLELLLKSNWMGDGELSGLAAKIRTAIAKYRESVDEERLRQTLVDQDASFLISTMRANPGNTKIAMLSLKMMEEAESGFLEADDLESNLRFLLQTQWANDKTLAPLALKVLDRVMDAGMPTTNVKTYNDSAATVASVCEDVSKVPDGKLATDQLYRLLEAINKFPDDMDLSIAIATGIWRLANAMPQKDRRTVWRGTGIVAIIRALGVHIKNPTVLIWLTRILALLSEDDQLKSLIGIHGGIPAIFNVVRAYSKVGQMADELRQSCVETVALVAYRNPANIAEIVKDNGIPLLVGLIDRGEEPVDLTINVLVALTNVGYMNNRNKVEIVAKGGGRAAAQVLDRSTVAENTLALQVAMRCVAALATVEENANALVDDNVVKLINNAIKKHADHVVLAEQAAQTLQNLSGCREQQKEAIVKQRGVQLCISLWEAHPSNVVVVDAVLRCLHQLCASTQTTTGAIPALICKLRGLEILLQQNDALLARPTLAEVALLLYADLALNETICGVITNQNVVVKVIACAEKHQLSMGIVKPALALIGILASSTSAICKQVAEQGALRWPESLMIRAPDNVELWSECVKALTALACAPANVTRNTDPFIKLVAEGLTRFTHNVQFVKNSAVLWSRLALHPYGTRQMLDKGCIPDMLTALTEHSDAAVVVEKFVRAMLNMVTVELASYSVLVREKAGRLVKELATRHTSNRATLKACQAFIARMDELAAMDSHIGSIRDRVPKDVLNMMTAGVIVRKMPGGSSKLLSVSEDCQYLVWQDLAKTKAGSLALCHVMEVRPGACTPALQGKPLIGKQADPAASFAIFDRRRPQKPISVEAPNGDTARAWIKSLELLQKLNYLGNSKESFDSSKGKK
ncbi:Myosin motor domain-containing protein [Plasmodiophora brassicae]|uniref:Myosin motor domain-containing protein n=1 Tax=Plasmodiophora brassicae TaxID=37360 RepID=A0A3P3YKQ8_PLABS|nr:unnamed protein product [Plasmodiophora brassicae]